VAGDRRQQGDVLAAEAKFFLLKLQCRFGDYELEFVHCKNFPVLLSRWFVQATNDQTTMTGTSSCWWLKSDSDGSSGPRGAIVTMSSSSSEEEEGAFGEDSGAGTTMVRMVGPSEEQDGFKVNAENCWKNGTSTRRRKAAYLLATSILVGSAMALIGIAFVLAKNRRDGGSSSSVGLPPSSFPPRSPDIKIDSEQLDSSEVPTLISSPTSTPSNGAPLPSPTLAPSELNDDQFVASSKVTTTIFDPSPTDTPTSLSCEQKSLSPPPTFPGKKGVCMTLRSEGQEGSWLQNLPLVVALRPHWNYNWGLFPIDEQPDDIEFVPMVWGSWGERTIEKLQSNLTQVVEGSSSTIKRILGYNEPDAYAQSNMNLWQATSAWPILESMDLPLISPSCADPGGQWMEKFMALSDSLNCSSSRPRVDYVGVHWYGGPDVEAFQSKMTGYYDMYGKRPLVVTEFAIADWEAKTVQDNRFSRQVVLDFMKEVIPWVRPYWSQKKKSKFVLLCTDTNHLIPLPYFAINRWNRRTGLLDMRGSLSAKHRRLVLAAHFSINGET